MKQFPKDPITGKYSCPACKKVIPETQDYLDPHYHRCPFCAYNLQPEGA